MAIPYRCERCGEVLRPEDVRVADDIATCRVCRYTGPFVGGQRIPKLSDEDLARPPAGVSLQKRPGDTLTLVCRPPRQNLWFLLSSAGAVVLALLAALRVDRTIGFWGMALPVAAWLSVAGLAATTVYLAMGRLVIGLGRGRLRVHRGVWGIGQTRNVVMGPETRVSLQTSDHRLKKVPQLEVVVQTGRSSIRFGALDLTPEARKYVAAVLRRAAGGG